MKLLLLLLNNRVNDKFKTNEHFCFNDGFCRVYKAYWSASGLYRLTLDTSHEYWGWLLKRFITKTSCSAVYFQEKLFFNIYCGLNLVLVQKFLKMFPDCGQLSQYTHPHLLSFKFPWSLQPQLSNTETMFTLYLPKRWIPTVSQNKSYKWINHLCPDQWPNIMSKIILILIFFLWPSAVPWWICDKSSEKPSQKGEILGWRPDCFHSLWDIKGRYFEIVEVRICCLGLACNRT